MVVVVQSQPKTENNALPNFVDLYALWFGGRRLDDHEYPRLPRPFVRVQVGVAAPLLSEVPGPRVWERRDRPCSDRMAMTGAL